MDRRAEALRTTDSQQNAPYILADDREDQSPVPHALDQEPAMSHNTMNRKGMRVAILVTHAGVPRTLGTTSFVSALAEGLEANQIVTSVVSLARTAEIWRSDAMPKASVLKPWIGRSEPRAQDPEIARSFGISVPDEARTTAATSGAWYEEYLLERELASFAGGRRLHLIVHPRSYELLDLATRVARRRGWGVIVLSNEALTDTQIDPDSRDAYVELASSATGIWAVSDYLRDFWIDHGVPGGRILVLPGMISPSLFSHQRDTVSRGALYMGNLMHREVDTLLDVSARVVASEPSFRLTIFGDATAERASELRETINQRGLADVVRVEDALPPHEIPGALTSARVLLLPRASGVFSSAGFPQKLGEYLASGTPVVVTGVGDIPKYLVDGVSAYVVNADDTDAFTAAVVRALRDPDASRVGSEGRELADELLNSQAASMRLVAFLKALHVPCREWGTLQILTAKSRMHRLRLAEAWHRWLAKARRSVVFAPSGHTRVMAAKIAIVRLLRFLRLKPPVPPRGQ